MSYCLIVLCGCLPQSLGFPELNIQLSFNVLFCFVFGKLMDWGTQLFQSACPTFLSIKQLLVYHLYIVRTSMMHFSLPSNYLNTFVCASSGPFCMSFTFSKPLGPPAGRINVAPLSCIIMTCINPIHHSTASPSALFPRQTEVLWCHSFAHGLCFKCKYKRVCGCEGGTFQAK